MTTYSSKLHTDISNGAYLSVQLKQEFNTILYCVHFVSDTNNRNSTTEK